GMERFPEDGHFVFFAAEAAMARQRTEYVGGRAGALYLRVKRMLDETPGERYRRGDGVGGGQRGGRPEGGEWGESGGGGGAGGARQRRESSRAAPTRRIGKILGSLTPPARRFLVEEHAYE